jgi:hypothetical protein
MTSSYTVQVGTDNRGPERLIVAPRLALSAKPPEISVDVIITGPSPVWRAPTEASGFRTDEERRAEAALRGHLAMREHISAQWKRIPASEHEHVQLLSEPDD